MSAVTITQEHLDGFAAISGDDNPIHTDAEYAASTAFERPVAHGIFLFALVRAELRRRWPEARLTEQQLTFPAPTPVGTVVRVEIDETATDDGRVRAETRVRHDDGTVGLTGDCVLDIAGGIA